MTERNDKINLRFILSGFGVELSQCFVSLELHADTCLPIAYSSDFFIDGAVEV